MEMNENNYFKATVKTSYEDSKGRQKFKKENYIVVGISPTDVETKIAKELEGTDYELVGVNVINIVDIIK
jgi:hypothetical protein